jgi:orotate phosphoribosyltransferase
MKDERYNPVEMPGQKKELINCLGRTGAVRFGDFTLSSGKKSQYYVDKYLFETDPLCLHLLGRMLKKCIPQDADLLAGIELGSIALAAATSMESGIPFVIVRREKKDYGTARQVEGNFKRGQAVLLIEDVTTTGSGIIKAAAALRNAGLTVNRCVCVVDRQEGAALACGSAGLILESLLTASDILTAGA